MKNKELIIKGLVILLIGIIIGFFIGKINVPPTQNFIPENYNQDTVLRAVGNPKAKVVMVEYGDFQCPLCKVFFDDNFAKLKKDYIDTGKVYFIFKQFPLNIHPLAPGAAIASDCALAQNKFWEYHDMLYQKQDEWTQSQDYIGTLKQYAADLKLDTNKFDQCLDQRTTVNQVKADYLEGVSKGITGTPTFYLNDQTIVGAQDWSVFQAKLDQLLK